MCDDKGPTVCLIKSGNDMVFGGYLDKSWLSFGAWQPAEGAFVFSMTKKTKHE